MGDYHLDNFSSSSDPYSGLDWSLFVLATTFTATIILNMLIAIMGDTFDKINENPDQFRLKLKLEVLSDYCFLFGKGGEGSFLYVAELLQMIEAEANEWEGRLKAINKQITKQFNTYMGELKGVLAKIKKDIGLEAQSSQKQADELK